MNPEDIGKILDEIGERIGPAGEYAWELAVRYQFIDGILNLIFGLLIGSFTFAAWRFVWNQTGASNDIDRGMIRALSSIGAFVVIVFCMFWVGGSVVQLLNPEWSAIRDVIRAPR